MPQRDNSGTTFEKEISRRLGLARVPGSGNQWHSKLDLTGRLSRWSLKFTEKDRYSLKQSDIDEMDSATQSLTGDGRIPLMLLRLAEPKYDLVVMHLEDFLAMQDEGVEFMESAPGTSRKRAEAAKIPGLFRRQDEEAASQD